MRLGMRACDNPVSREKTRNFLELSLKEVYLDKLKIYAITQLQPVV
jgi:hypothetical protein